MRRWKRPLTAACCLVMAAAPVQAYASESTDFTYTEEQLARMQDNNLDYDELAWLIDKYNATVLNNKQEFSDFKKDYGLTKDDVSQSYQDLADELENNISGEDDAGSLISDLSIDTRVKNLRETADDNLEDSAIIWWGYEEARDNLVVVAQSNMINYQKSLIELEVKKKNAELAEAEYNLTLAKRAAGTVTDMEVLNAKESMINAQAAVTTMEADIKEVKQKLCVMTGWSYNAEPVIGSIPEPDMERAASLNPAGDLETALANNYTLKTNKRKLENATAESKKTTLRQTIKENEQQIGVSLNNAARNVDAARIAYEQAVSASDLEEKNLSLASQKLQAGMITEIAYKQQDYKTAAARAEKETSKMKLFEALETYEWAVKGLASA